MVNTNLRNGAGVVGTLDRTVCTSWNILVRLLFTLPGMMAQIAQLHRVECIWKKQLTPVFRNQIAGTMLHAKGARASAIVSIISIIRALVAKRQVLVT